MTLNAARPEPGAEARRASRPGARAFLGRVVLAHFIAYPVSLAAAIGSVPVAVWVRRQSILEARASGARWRMLGEALEKYRVSATEAAQVQIVLDFVIAVSVALFALIHLAALPWAIDAARAAGQPRTPGQKRNLGFRLFVGTTAATLLLIALSATAGWSWLLLQ